MKKEIELLEKNKSLERTVYHQDREIKRLEHRLNERIKENCKLLVKNEIAEKSSERKMKPSNPNYKKYIDYCNTILTHKKANKYNTIEDNSERNSFDNFLKTHQIEIINKFLIDYKTFQKKFFPKTLSKS